MAKSSLPITGCKVKALVWEVIVCREQNGASLNKHVCQSMTGLLNWGCDWPADDGTGVKRVNKPRLWWFLQTLSCHCSQVGCPDADVQTTFRQQSSEPSREENLQNPLFCTLEQSPHTHWRACTLASLLQAVLAIRFQPRALCFPQRSTKLNICPKSPSCSEIQSGADRQTFRKVGLLLLFCR